MENQENIKKPSKMKSGFGPIILFTSIIVVVVIIMKVVFHM